MLPGVLVPVRPVVPLDEGGVDRRAHRRASEKGVEPGQRPEYQCPHHLDHAALLTHLANRGVADVGGEDPLGLGRSPRPGTLRLGLLDAVDLPDRRLLRGMLVAGDQHIRPPRRPVVDLLDHLLASRACPLARHQAEQEPALGIDRGVVPVVTPQPVQRVEGIARLLLLRDGGPLLVDLDLAGPGGKRPPTPGGGARHGPRPMPRSV